MALMTSSIVSAHPVLAKNINTKSSIEDKISFIFLKIIENRPLQFRQVFQCPHVKTTTRKGKFRKFDELIENDSDVVVN